MSKGEQSVRFARAVSSRVDELTDALIYCRLLGWTYTLSWSASFYPQPLLNWRRKSTHGLAIDFPTINVLGFVCYTISTSTFLYSTVIREQYAARHLSSPEPTVQLNDLAFALHALILTVLTYSQFFPSLWGFTVGRFQHISRPVAGIVCGGILAVLLVILIVRLKSSDGGYNPTEWAWIDVIYAIGYIKLVVTCVKYVPQVWVNYKRKSTQGWSIWQILFDLTGGVLSILQLVIDSSLQADWSGIMGNPVKLGLGNVSIFFDLIFITQHYILYVKPKELKYEDNEGGSQESLLDGGSSNHG